MTDLDVPTLEEDAELLGQKPRKRVVTLTHEYLIHEDGDQARALAERDAAIEYHLKQGYTLSTTFFIPVSIKATIVDTLTR